MSSKTGFSLIELLTTISIIGTLSIVGIKTYQAQTNKARSAEAKYSLSYIWNAEESFRESWGTYHENLMVIGAIPAGSYHYDVGFSSSATISTTDGDLEDYPSVVGLGVANCLHFFGICNGDCSSSTSSVDSNFATYFSPTGTYRASTNCVVRCRYGSDCTFDYSSATLPVSGATIDADESSFTAIAVGKLKNQDVWSINNFKTLTHEEDGTE